MLTTRVTAHEVATLTDRALMGRFAPVSTTPELVYRVTNRMLGEIAGFSEFNWITLSRYPVTLDYLSDRFKGERVLFITSDYNDDGDPVIVYVMENHTQVFTYYLSGITYLRARTYVFNPLDDTKSRFMTTLYLLRDGEACRV